MSMVVFDCNLYAEPNHKFAAIKPEELAKIHDALPDAIAKPAKPRKLLVFFRTEGFVHGSIPYCNEAIKEMGEKTGAYTADFSDDMSVFTPDNLKQYDGVLFNSTTQLKFADEANRTALLDFVKSGKGVIGIHAATDNFPTWPEGQELLGGKFNGHPWHAGDVEAVKVDDPKSPMNASFGGTGFWIHDEIYQMGGPYDRAKVRVLLSLDMSKPQNARNPKDIKRTDNDFPISWIKKEVAGGRVFYCSLGHNPDIFWTKPVLQHYLNGIQFALGDLDLDAVPSAQIDKASIPTPALAPDVIATLNSMPPPKPGQPAVPAATTPAAASTPVETPAPTPQKSAEYIPSSLYSALAFGTIGEVTTPSGDPVAAGINELSAYDFGGGKTQIAGLIEVLRTQGTSSHAAIETALIPLLSDAKTPVGGKDIVCRLLGMVGSDKAVPALSPLISDTRLNHMAVYALFEIGTPAAQEALLNSLDGLPTALQPSVIGALGRLHDSAAVPALGKRTVSSSDDVTIAAVDALAEIGTRDAGMALVALKIPLKLQDVFDWAFVRTAKQLFATGEDKSLAHDLIDAVLKSSKVSSLRIAAVKALIQAQAADSWSALSQLLTSTDGHTAVDAARLTRYLSAQDGDSLMGQFATLAPAVQVVIVNSVSENPTPFTVKLLEKALASSDLQVHFAAISGYGAADLPESGLALIPLLSIPNDSDAATQALSELKKSDPLASKDLDLSKEPPAQKIALLNLIAGRQDAKLKDAVMSCTSDPNKDVANAAYRAVAVLASGEDMPMLLDLLTKATTGDQIKCLNPAVIRSADLSMDKPKTEAALVAALPKVPANNRPAIILALASMGTPTAIQSISDLLKDPSIDNRKALIRTLSEGRNPGADQLLIQAAKNGTEDSEKILAVRGYLDSIQAQKVSPDERVAALSQAWALTVRQEERDAILAALKSIRGEPAKKALKEFSSAPAITPAP